MNQDNATYKTLVLNLQSHPNSEISVEQNQIQAIRRIARKMGVRIWVRYIGGAHLLTYAGHY